MSWERDMQDACCDWPRCERSDMSVRVLIGVLCFAGGVLAMGIAYDYRNAKTVPVVSPAPCPQAPTSLPVHPRLVWS